MPRRLTQSAGATALVAVLVVISGASPGLADDTADARCGPNGCTADSHRRVEHPAQPTQPRSTPATPSPVVCQYVADGPGVGSDAGDPHLADTSTLKVGDKVWVACRNTETGETQPMYPTTWGADAAPARSPEAVARDALAAFAFTPAVVESWPATRHTVGIRSYFHVRNFADLGRRAGADTDPGSPGNVHATVTATPLRTIWRLGPGPDGQAVTLECEGAGTVWHEGLDDCDPSLCGTTFWHHGAYPATVEIVYGVSWTSSTGAGGTLTAPPQATPFTVTVRPIEAVIR